jgi:hypothetical protein
MGSSHSIRVFEGKDEADVTRFWKECGLTTPSNFAGPRLRKRLAGILARRFLCRAGIARPYSLISGSTSRVSRLSDCCQPR